MLLYGCCKGPRKGYTKCRLSRYSCLAGRDPSAGAPLSSGSCRALARCRATHSSCPSVALMHARTKPRTAPYVWATWVTKLLAGESSCLWSAWFRAHHQFAKTDRADFDLDRWQMDHTAVVRRAAAEFVEKGYTVLTEHQNQFALAGKLGTLAGRPDVVAIRGDEGWIADGKTGQPRASDRVQVQLYIWALKKANPAYAGVRFRGRVEYMASYNLIDSEEVDAVFATRVAELMKVICGPDEPPKSPSFGECRCCPLTREDCADRVETEAVLAGVTDEF